MSEPAYAVRLSHAIVSKSWRQIIEKVIAFEEKLDDGGFIEVTEVCWSHRKQEFIVCYEISDDEDEEMSDEKFEAKLQAYLEAGWETDAPRIKATWTKEERSCLKQPR